MQIQLDLPEDVVSAMVSTGQDFGRATTESIALEGYRSGRLTEEQIRRLLGFDSRFDVHAFLKEHGVYFNYTEEDLERDIESAREFGKRWRSSQTPHR